MLIKNFVPLVSKRILIRPAVLQDAFALNQAIAHSLTTLQLWMDWAFKHQTLKDTERYLNYTVDCWHNENPKELPLLIFNADQTELMGSIGLNAIDWQIPCFEIGYWISQNYTGKGFITEAVNILTQFVFLKWNAKRVEIRCDSENTKSQAVAERLNFALEAHFKNHRIQPYTKKLSGTLVYARYDTKDLPFIQDFKL